MRLIDQKSLWVISYNPISFNYLARAGHKNNSLMYLDTCVDTVGTSSSSSMYRHFRHSTCCANTCNRPVNLCSDLLPCPNPYPLYNLVMVRLTLPLPPSTPLPSPRSCSRCALCQKNRKESRLRDENESKLKASFTFLPPKIRVSGNWKMFISRCSTFEGHLDRGVLHMVYHICKLYNLPRTAAKAACPWHQV